MKKPRQTKVGTAVQPTPSQPGQKLTGLDDRFAPRQKNRERTLADLQVALKTLQGSGQKITLKAVADLAMVSPSLLNHRYPDFAEQVRGLVGRTIRQQRNEKADMLIKEREKNRQLRTLVDSQLMEITRLASVNETLRQELALQRAIAEGKVSKGPFGQKTSREEPSRPPPTP